MGMGKAGSPARRPLHDSVEVRGHGVEVLLVVRPGSHLDADLQEDCPSGGRERETSVMSCVSSVGMSGWVVVLLPEMGRLAETKEVFYLVSL